MYRMGACKGCQARRDAIKAGAAKAALVIRKAINKAKENVK